MAELPTQMQSRKFHIADIVPWLQRFEDKFDHIQVTYDDRIGAVERKSIELEARQDNMCGDVTELKQAVDPLKVSVTVLNEQVRVLNKFMTDLQKDARWLLYLVAGILITSLINIILHP
jgi:hypothetical protein